MNINLNNYEEYFLLYADNELPDKERHEVENFVKQFPEFEEEFNMVKLTINFPDESVSLVDKSFLLKNKTLSFINENNYEEAFVLYHDNELTNEQKSETEKFVNQHPELKVEFELIGNAKLIHDASIVFPGKKRLYRKEKSGRVIPMIFWKYAAAAVLIGVGLWFSASYFNLQEDERALSVHENNTKSQKIDNQIIVPQTTTDKENTALSSAKEKIIQEEKTNNNKEEKVAKIIQEKKRNSNTIAKSDLGNENLIKEKVIEIKEDNILEIMAANDLIRKAPDLQRTNSILAKNEIAGHVDEIEILVQPNQFAQNASFSNSVELADVSTSNDNYFFYNVPSDEFKKSKVGGFLKKVKRIVERSNPITRLLSGDDKQIAAK
jgi:hypothetical protein